MSELMAKGKFNGTGNTQSDGGINGVGAAAVNQLERLDAAMTDIENQVRSELQIIGHRAAAIANGTFVLSELSAFLDGSSDVPLFEDIPQIEGTVTEGMSDFELTKKLSGKS